MRRLNSLTGIPLLVLLITTIHGFPALAAEDHAADFQAGYFFIDVFGCLFPMNDDYVLKVTAGESYFFWNRNYALGSPPSDIKRISVESAENVEELIANHGLQLRDADLVQHIVHDGKYQITIMNESSNEVGKKIRYCIANPSPSS
jgi:hypothetical protein